MALNCKKFNTSSAYHLYSLKVTFRNEINITLRDAQGESLSVVFGRTPVRRNTLQCAKAPVRLYHVVKKI